MTHTTFVRSPLLAVVDFFCMPIVGMHFWLLRHAMIESHITARSPALKMLFFLIVFLDILGVALIIPLLPTVYEHTGLSLTIIGFIDSLYGCAQLVGSPIMGRLGDRFGHQWAFRVSLSGATISYAMLAFASPPSPWRLVASRVIVGLTKQTVSLAHAYVTDTVSDDARRVTMIGRVGALVGVSFTIGPALGGALARYAGTYAPLQLATLLFVVDVLLAFLFLKPRGIQAVRKEHVERPQAATSHHRFVSFRLLVLIIAFNIGFMTLRTNMSYLLRQALGLDPSALGVVLSLVGVVGIVTKSALLPALLRRFDSPQLLQLGSVISAMASSLLAVALASPTPSARLCFLLFVPIFAGIAIASTALVSIVSAAAPRSHAGAALGEMAAIESACRLIAPIVGTNALRLANFAPSVISSTAFIAASLMKPTPPKPKKE